MVVRAIIFTRTCTYRDRRLDVLTYVILANEWQLFITLVLHDMSLFNVV
jgi:hypothetical protein